MDLPRSIVIVLTVGRDGNCNGSVESPLGDD
jgi:hypothetical protein